MASWDNTVDRIYKSQSLDDLTMLGRKDSIWVCKEEIEECKGMLRGALSEENLMEVRTFSFQKKEEDEKEIELTLKDIEMKKKEMAISNKGVISGGQQHETEMLMMIKTIGQCEEGDKAVEESLEEELQAVKRLNQLEEIGEKLYESEDNVIDTKAMQHLLAMKKGTNVRNKKKEIKEVKKDHNALGLQKKGSKAKEYEAFKQLFPAKQGNEGMKSEKLKIVDDVAKQNLELERMLQNLTAHVEETLKNKKIVRSQIEKLEKKLRLEGLKSYQSTEEYGSEEETYFIDRMVAEEIRESAMGHEIKQLVEQGRMPTNNSNSKEACDRKGLDNQRTCTEMELSDNEANDDLFEDGLNANAPNFTVQKNMLFVNEEASNTLDDIEFNNDACKERSIGEDRWIEKITFSSIKQAGRCQLIAFDLMEKNDDEISLGEFSPRQEKESSSGKIRSRFPLRAKSEKGQGSDFEETFEEDCDCTFRLNDQLKTIKESASQTNLVKIRNSGILRKEKYKKMSSDKKKKRVRFSKLLPKSLRRKGSSGGSSTEVEQHSMGFLSKESKDDSGMFRLEGDETGGILHENDESSFENSNNKIDDCMMNSEFSLKWELFWSNESSAFDAKEETVLEDDDQSKVIEVVAKKESKKGENQKDKTAETEKEKDEKYSAKLKKEQMKLEKKINKREEKEMKRMRKEELKLSKKQEKERKEVGHEVGERLEDAKYKAREEKRKVKEEKKKAKEFRKLAEEERKREIEEAKNRKKEKESEEKERIKEEKKRKKEQLKRIKEIHAAFLKEKKRKDKQWKLDVKRGDNKEKVRELRNKEVKKMTYEKIFMASSVKRELEELSKGKSILFRKPFVAWDEEISNHEDVQNKVESGYFDRSQKAMIGDQGNEVIEINYHNDGWNDGDDDAIFATRQTHVYSNVVEIIDI